MERKKRPLNRISNVRDSKLYVIATEGELTEKLYFLELSLKYRNPRVHVEILDRLNSNNSAPNHVLMQLDKFKKEYHLKKDDELWMVIDLDRWHNSLLSDISKQCIQKKYNLAVSNPCFEIWLILHVSDFNDCFASNFEELKSNDFEKELRRLLGSYNKAKPDFSEILPNIEVAINRAKALDIDPDCRLPKTFGSRVYKLVEKII